MSLTDDYSPEFERLWKAWPRKPVGRSKKKPSYTAFQKANKVLCFTAEDLAFIEKDIEVRARKDEKWLLGFVPMFATYFNQRWWNEPYATDKTQVPVNGIITTDEDNKRAWALDQQKRGAEVPIEYQKYLLEPGDVLRVTPVEMERLKRPLF